MCTARLTDGKLFCNSGVSMLVLSAQQEDKETLGLFAARMKRWNGAGAGGGQPSLGKNVFYRASASSSRQQSSKPGKT